MNYIHKGGLCLDVQAHRVMDMACAEGAIIQIRMSSSSATTQNISMLIIFHTSSFP